jgi:hypothetical protein
MIPSVQGGIWSSALAGAASHNDAAATPQTASRRFPVIDTHRTLPAGDVLGNEVDDPGGHLLMHGLVEQVVPGAGKLGQLEVVHLRDPGPHAVDRDHRVIGAVDRQSRGGQAG